MKTHRSTAAGSRRRRPIPQFWSTLLVLAAFVAAPWVRAQLPQIIVPTAGALVARGDRILVKPRAGVQLDALHLLLGTTVRKVFPALGNLQVVELPAGSLVASVLATFLQSGLVEYAEPDATVRLLAEPNDFRFFDGSLWGLRNTGQLGGTPGADIKASQGWDIRNDATAVVVAVIDTGVRLTHEDLAPNLWTNTAEIAGNGIDDDGNGFVDDVHGINAITGTGDPSDDHGHGSHVSGGVGAMGNNSVGVVGVAWRVQLMECKFIDPQGEGAVSDAITCIEYAISKNADIINASWGGPGFESAALRDAIAHARDAGILFVAAAGNSQGDNDVAPLYPATFPLDNIISVASTNRNDGLSFFSNYGANTVHLGAPGEDIFSCWGGNDADYRFFSGSSMAASYVSGAAAVLMAQFASDGYAAIKQRILAGTQPLPSLAGKTVTGGRLDLMRALTDGVPPPPAPAAPSGLSATAISSSQINLAWTDNANNEQSFDVERSADNVTFARIAVAAANATSFANTGLTASTTYHYRVRAVNATGNSSYSNPASATTQAVQPEQPVVTVVATDSAAAEAGPDNGVFTISRSGATTAALTVRFTLGGTAANGTDYESLSDSLTLPAGAASAQLVVRPIDDNQVEGNETVGISLSSDAAYTIGSPGTAALTITDNDSPPPPQPPAAPSGLNASAISTSAINITWTDNAGDEQGFHVERSTDNATFTNIATLGANFASHSDSGLTASTTYYYRVRAFNAAGNSAYSNTASATTQSAPPPPPPPPAKPTVTVSTLIGLAAELGPISGTYQVKRQNAPIDQPLTVHFGMAGTATNGVDYQAIGTSVTIPANASTATIVLTPINDRLAEITETATLIVAPDAAYLVGPSDRATITIADDDLPLVGPLLGGLL